MTTAWTPLCQVATPYVTRDSCLTTEPPRRSCTPARGLLPLCGRPRDHRGGAQAWSSHTVRTRSRQQPESGPQPLLIS
ncbi:hypothetical protein QTO34_016096, partial [Cnephaeus nilssonii]